jgi:hypothetical protein
LRKLNFQLEGRDQGTRVSFTKRDIRFTLNVVSYCSFGRAERVCACGSNSAISGARSLIVRRFARRTCYPTQIGTWMSSPTLGNRWISSAQEGNLSSRASFRSSYGCLNLSRKLSRACTRSESRSDYRINSRSVAPSHSMSRRFRTALKSKDLFY